MQRKHRLTTYILAELINLTLAYPFISFLLWPEKATAKFIESVSYILFLRVASMFASTELYRLKTHRKIQVMSLVCVGLILWSVTSRIGPTVLVYFAGSMLMDALFLLQQDPKKSFSFMLNLVYKSFLLLPLFFIASMVSSLIYQHYYHATMVLSSSIKGSSDVKDLVSGVLLLVFYYVFEPFAELLFNLLFDPKSKVGRFLNTKI